MPFRISFTPYVAIDQGRLDAYLSAAKEYPRATRGVHPHPVAVVGGGASTAERLEELRGWPGDIWAINLMADWLSERGIDSTLITVDPAPFKSKARKALLASCCCPDVFQGRNVTVFDLVEHAEDGIAGGVTTAARTPALALRMGYPGVAFFGCDSSFGADYHLIANHAQDDQDEMVIVEADGRRFTTTPGLLMQADNLALLIRTFSAFFVNKSGGLLEAMVADDQWTTVGVSAALKRKLIETNGDSGLYDEPYQE